MAERDWLRHLKMGEARHGIGCVLQRTRGQRAHERRDLAADAINRVAHPEAEICRHLVVARACCMQALASLTDVLRETCLDIHVNIFEILREIEIARFDVARNPVQPVADFLFLGSGQQADACQHGGVSQRAAYVLTP